METTLSTGFNYNLTTPPTTTPPTTTPTLTTPPDLGTPPTTTPPAPGGGLLSTDSFSQVSGIIGSGLGGGIATIKSMSNLKLIGQGMRGVEVPSGAPGAEETTKIGGGFGDKLKGIGMGMKSLGGSAITGAKWGAIMGGAVSSITNTYQVLTGQKSGSDAVGTVAADTVTATLSGAGGAVVGGMTALGLSAFGLGGLPVTILAGGLGLAGAVGVHLLTQKTGLYDSIKNGVKDMLGGTTTA